MEEDDEVIIEVKKGVCDCCYEENIDINICPSNNKCEYAMCDTCIGNIMLLSDDKKNCPACREQIFFYEEDTTDDEVDELATSPRRELRLVRCCFCCLIEYDRVNRSRSCIKRQLEFIFGAYCYTPVVCFIFCLYQAVGFPIIIFYKTTQQCYSLDCVHKRIRPIITVLIMKVEIVIALMLFQLYHLMVLNKEIEQFWEGGILGFLIGAAAGAGFLLATIFGLLLGIGLFCHCCCDFREEDGAYG